MRVSLEQWRCLVAVVDHGSYARAASALHRSQSAVTYAVQKLESTLGVEAFAIEGRKAVLTPTGRMLYLRAKSLIDDAERLEKSVHRVSAGWEMEIVLAMEVVFPTWLVLRCLDRFSEESPHTRIELVETVLGGSREALENGVADLAIAPSAPPSFGAEWLMDVHFLPVAHPDHPLHRLGRKLSFRDLREHRHILVRDSGIQRQRGAYTLESSQRWVVSNMPTAIGAICRGYGYAWVAELKIRDELDRGLLKPLPLARRRDAMTPLYLVFGDADAAGPGVHRLAGIIREEVSAMAAPGGGAVRPDSTP
jgi:DNA-binding transcriptional LysR family regulator